MDFTMDMAVWIGSTLQNLKSKLYEFLPVFLSCNKRGQCYVTSSEFTSYKLL
jgi:hypothetical protein